MRTPLWSVCAVALMMGGCSSINETNPSTLIPNDVLSISTHYAPTMESIAVGVALYFIVDPLAPNWQIQQAQLGADTYRIQMRKKRFTTGGDGEAPQVFYRRAEQLTRETGATGYRIVAFSEGIESNVPIAQRVAQGVIEVLR